MLNDNVHRCLSDSACLKCIKTSFAYASPGLVCLALQFHLAREDDSKNDDNESIKNMLDLLTNCFRKLESLTQRNCVVRFNNLLLV